MRGCVRSLTRQMNICAAAMVFAASSFAGENVLDLGLPFVMENQGKGASYWDVKSGDYFFHLEGRYYGWDNSTVEVSSAGPGTGPAPHTHPVEEFFILTEGSAAFTLGEKIIHVKAPALVRVPPNTSHNITSLDPERTTTVTFFPSNSAPNGPSNTPDPFAHIKTDSPIIAQVKAGMAQMITRHDTNKDGRLSMKEVPEHFQDKFSRFDKDKDGYISGDELKN